MEVVKDEKQINYAEYGYTEDAKITIDADLFGKLVELINYVGKRESFIAFEQKKDIQETFDAKNEAKHVLTPQGLLALSVSLRLNKLHEDNVDSGVAVHQDELDKPKITLE